MNEERRLEEKAKIKGDYQALFDSELGKRVLEHMLSQVYIGRTPFVKGDPYQTAFNAGGAQVVLAILDLVDGVDLRVLIDQAKQTNQRRNMQYE